MAQRRNWSLIGIPDHEAVFNVGGRVGAASGPAAFRRVFRRLSGELPLHELLKHDVDVQELGPDIEKNHERAATLIESCHSATGTTVVVGGSHDHGYSQVLGISRSIQNLEGLKNKKRKNPLTLGCLNLDAHLDVRPSHPKITSGSPFYLAIENKVILPEHLIEFGIQEHCNAPLLWAYVKSRRVQVIPWSRLRGGVAVDHFATALKSLSSKVDAIVLSFDLDAVAQAFSPGVSAPQAEGLSSSEALACIEIAAENPKVVSLGIFELNPEHDHDDQSARLAATAAYHFAARKV